MLIAATGGADLAAEQPKQAPAAGSARSNGSGGSAVPAESSSAALPPAAVDSNDVTTSLDFLKYLPPVGTHLNSTAGPGSSLEMAPKAAALAAPAAARAAAAAPAASAPATLQAPPAAAEQQQRQHPAANGGGSQGADEAPRQQAAEGVEQAEQLLDIVFVSSEAGEWTSTLRRPRSTRRRCLLDMDSHRDASGVCR